MSLDKLAYGEYLLDSTAVADGSSTSTMMYKSKKKKRNNLTNSTKAVDYDLYQVVLRAKLFPK